VIEQDFFESLNSFTQLFGSVACFICRREMPDGFCQFGIVAQRVSSVSFIGRPCTDFKSVFLFMINDPIEKPFQDV
jgi:hypothetical protein